MPVKYIGSTAPESDLYGVSHWPARNEPPLPSIPIAGLRDAKLEKPPSTLMPDSTWKNTERSLLNRSRPRKPRLDEFDVTRVRRGTSTPVGVLPRAPAGKAPSAVAPRASTDSTSTLSVP